MRFTKLVLGCLVVSAMVAASSLAQEGFPLKGSWLGDWGPNGTMRNQAFIVLDWDGKSISGMINPGTDNIPLKNATLTPPPAAPPAAGGRNGAAAAASPAPVVPREWLVHFEADGKDRSGATVRYVIDGKIENVGLSNRAVVGTWMVGTTKNDFRIVRQ